MRSSHAHFVETSGLRWVSLVHLAPIPRALPFLTVMLPSGRYNHQRSFRYQTFSDRARQTVVLVRHWLPKRELVMDGSTYGAIE